MSSEDVQFHAGAFSNCSVTFNINNTNQLSPNFLSVRNQFYFQLHLMSMFSIFFQY